MGLPAEYINLVLLKRLGFCSPDQLILYMLAVAFLAYHGLRRNHTQLIMVARNLGDYSEVHKCFIELSSYHWKNIRPANWQDLVQKNLDQVACGSATPVRMDG